MTTTRENPTTARRRERIIPAIGAPITVRIEPRNHPGTLANVTATVGKHGGNLDAIDIVNIRADKVSNALSRWEGAWLNRNGSQERKEDRW